MTTYGYLRVSTDAQSTGMQLDAMRAAGITEIFQDVGVSGATAAKRRAGAKAMMDKLQPGDTLAVYSISRFGRSARDLLVNLEDLQARGVKFRSLTEPFDMDHYLGKFVVTLLAAVAEMERSMINERVKAGVATAKARGVKGGRPVRHADATELRALVDGGVSLVAAAKQLGIKRSTAQRMMKR